MDKITENKYSYKQHNHVVPRHFSHNISVGKGLICEHAKLVATNILHHSCSSFVVQCRKWHKCYKRQNIIPPSGLSRLRHSSDIYMKT